MTAKTAIAAGLAVLTSAAVHGALLGSIAAPAGGTDTPPGGTEVSMIGQSFEDLAAGQLRPVSPPPGATAPVPPQASATTPTASPSRTPVVTETPQATPTRSADVSVPSTAAFATPDRVVAREAPPVRQPTADTPRPEIRPPPPAPAEAAPVPPPTPQGNADRNAQAGTAQGSTTGSATQRQGDAEAAPGPSAREIARYPQQVNRHLGRLRRPDSGFRGTAIIGFTIAPDGGLAALSIDRSSGDAGFDELALRHIRGAVPFPPPPAGGQTRYSVSVRGR
ncbi:MAG: periplasmic protein TonB [Rhodobacteraceae bacterium HLUCCO18]|nr:MAG: periplasmic protein TonB [Rhodobacteraceae bacterium HLUCCO18]